MPNLPLKTWVGISYFSPAAIKGKTKSQESIFGLNKWTISPLRAGWNLVRKEQYFLMNLKQRVAYVRKKGEEREGRWRLRQQFLIHISLRHQTVVSPTSSHLHEKTGKDYVNTYMWTNPKIDLVPRNSRDNRPYSPSCIKNKIAWKHTTGESMISVWSFYEITGTPCFSKLGFCFTKWNVCLVRSV